MVTQVEGAPKIVASRASHLGPGPHWHFATRIVFRLCFLYFSLYVLMTQMLGTLILPSSGFDLGTRPPMQPLVFWAASHLFGIHDRLVTASGSGDKMFDWLEAFVILLISVVATALWSLLDRKRKNYIDLHEWFRLFIRFALGSTMILYGMNKVIPLQMPAPFLTRLVEPFGNFSPSGVLWSFVGASRTYEIFTGCMELSGGILLFLPLTTTIGALICLADTVQIFMLNMTYDVPVKLFSFHLILLSLFLLAPDAPRLVSSCLSRATRSSIRPALFRRKRANQIAIAFQIALVMYLITTNLYIARQRWSQFGGGAPKSPLYGIWNVDEMSIDGQVLQPLLTDNDRWRRVIFSEQVPASVTFQRMDDTFVPYHVSIDASSKSLMLSEGNLLFLFQQPAPDHMVLDGEMDSHKIHMELELFDRNKFLLVNRGFHWIQEHPVNQ